MKSSRGRRIVLVVCAAAYVLYIMVFKVNSSLDAYQRVLSRSSAPLTRRPLADKRDTVLQDFATEAGEQGQLAAEGTAQKDAADGTRDDESAVEDLDDNDDDVDDDGEISTEDGEIDASESEANAGDGNSQRDVEDGAGRKPVEASSDIFCVVYDRPPHTGSTTIGSALSQCLSKHGYKKNGKGGRDYRHRFVDWLFEFDHPRKALLTNHFYMRQEDVTKLQNKCNKLFFVTSAAAMVDRLWSGAKFKMSKGNGNSTVPKSGHDYDRALTRYQSEHSYDHLEAYPYVEKGKPAVVPNKLKPDYVIRKDSLQEDLGSLLEAFGCEYDFMSRNIHMARSENPFASMKKYVGRPDTTFNDLLKVAEDNKDGLRKAREFY